MKNISYIIKTALLILILLIQVDLFAEFIFLKDGDIVEGKIIRQTGSYVTIRKKDGSVVKFNNKKVLRVLYADLNKVKLYCQKRDGTSFVAYLVAEDRDKYTFRKELYKPEEFTVARKDILFMAEKNPSGLKGRALPKSVKLSWLAPYGQVKKYNIYMKKNKEDDYKIVATTKDKEITISGLEMQTSYFFIVRAVDDTDYETNPSNEINIVTTSSLPSAPKVKVKKDADGNYYLTWEKSIDEDGDIVGYRIYKEKNGEYSLLKETKDLHYTVSNDVDFDTIHVRAYDENDDESRLSEYRGNILITVAGEYFMPMSDMADLAESGYGMSLSLSRRDTFMNNLTFGLKSGYSVYEGKDGIEDNSNMTSLSIVPLTIFAEYKFSLYFNRFNHFDVVSITPRVSLGGLAMFMDYELLDTNGDVDETKSATVIDPLLSVGVFLEIGVSRHFYFIAGAEYTYLIDFSGQYAMASGTFGVGFRF